MDIYLVAVDTTGWDKGARLDDLPAQGRGASQDGHCQSVSGEVGGVVRGCLPGWLLCRREKEIRRMPYIHLSPRERKSESLAIAYSKMASLLLSSFANVTQLSQLLFAAPPPLDGEYEGLEYTWKIFVFRPARESVRLSILSVTESYIHHKVFKNEVFLLAAVIMYGVFFWLGSEVNRTRANRWFVASHFLRVHTDH